MDISRTEKGARLRLSRQECREAGLSFESFGKNDAATERFLVAALGILRERGLIGKSPDTLDIDVAEDTDGMDILLGFRNAEKSVRVVRFCLPESFEAALHSVSGENLGCSLWSIPDGYALIFESRSLPQDSDEKILAAKIREHGKMLSCSPFELI